METMSAKAMVTVYPLTQYRSGLGVVPGEGHHPGTVPGPDGGRGVVRVSVRGVHAPGGRGPDCRILPHPGSMGQTEPRHHSVRLPARPMVVRRSIGSMKPGSAY